MNNLQLSFQTVVIECGDNSNDFAEEGLVVLFNNTAPGALRAFCYIIDTHQVNKEIVPGDTLMIDDNEYTIVRVGEYANENLSNLGHITLNFSGNYEDEIIGGSIYLNRELNYRIKKGTTLTIYSKD